MATRAESLIRQFSEARLKEITDQAIEEAKAVPDRVPLATLPYTLRQAVIRYQTHSRLVKQAEQVLTKAGIQTYNLRERSKEIQNPERDEARARVTTRRTKRVAAVRKLQDAAYIQVMGAKPADARAAVEAFQKALQKI